MNDYETRTLKIGVALKVKPIFDESMTTIEIEDESGGEYLKIIQSRDEIKPGTIYIEPDEWPALKAAIEKMIKECRDVSAT